MDEFASRLRFAIERSGMQQKNLASAIKLSPARLSNYVNGHSEPSLDILLLLCRELRVSADYLIGLTDTISAPAKSKEEKLPTDSLLTMERSRNPLDVLDSPYREEALNFIEYQRQKQASDLAEEKTEAK